MTLVFFGKLMITVGLGLATGSTIGRERVLGIGLGMATTGSYIYLFLH